LTAFFSFPRKNKRGHSEFLEVNLRPKLFRDAWRGSGGSVICLVCLVCVVRRMRETRPTRALDRLPGLAFLARGKPVCRDVSVEYTVTIL